HLGKCFFRKPTLFRVEAPHIEVVVHGAVPVAGLKRLSGAVTAVWIHPLPDRTAEEGKGYGHDEKICSTLWQQECLTASQVAAPATDGANGGWSELGRGGKRDDGTYLLMSIRLNHCCPPYSPVTCTASPGDNREGMEGADRSLVAISAPAYC